MWIDCHAHLSSLSDRELQEQIDSASSQSVLCIINTAADLESARAIARQCSIHPQLFGAAGITPFDIKGQASDWPEQLGSILDAPCFIAVGETGLDRSNPRYPPVDDQLPFFQAQLRIAQQRSLPAIVHSRGAEQLVLKQCIESGAERILFHCYTGDISTARLIMDKGYYISLSGIITFKNAGLEELARYIPADRLLIETDSPYLAPVPHRGKNNQPAFLKFTGEKLALLRGISPGTLQEQLKENFSRFFKKPL